MTDTQTYQGWKNYETWAVALWLDNDQGTYNLVREMAGEAIEDNHPANDPDNATYVLAERIEGFVKDSAPDLGATMFSDLLSAALSEVHWYEIAQNILSES